MKYVITPARRLWSLSIQLTGLLFFGTLYYLCKRYALERVLSFDGAFYMFQMMESGKPFTGLGRYADYLPELLPLMAFKLGWSLRSIIVAYSVSFMIVHYIFFLIATLVLRNNGAGIAMMLASCLSYYHSFYMPTVGLGEAVIAAILLWALIHPESPTVSRGQKIRYTIGAFLVIVYISFTHPLGIIAVLFVIGLEMTGGRRYKDYLLWAILIAGVGWMLLKSNVLFRHQYDQDQIIPLHEMFSNLSGWKDWPSTEFLKGFTWAHFRSVKWLALICLILSFRKGIILPLFLFLSFAGFTFLLLSNYRHGASFLLYESYYIIYGFLVGLTFVYLFYHPAWRNMTLLLALPFLYLSVKKINQAHTQFTDRLGYIERIVHAAQHEGGKKYIVDSRCCPADYVLATWDFGFETLFYSSLYSPDSTITAFIKTPAMAQVCDTTRNRNNLLLGVYFSPLWFTSNDMPARYFKLPATGYADLTHSQEDTSVHEEIYSAKNIQIAPRIQSLHVNMKDWTAVIPLEITNNSGRVIPAIPQSKNPVLVGIKLTDEHGATIIDEVSNPLETDIKNRSECGVTFYIPKISGTFYAQPDIITKGIRKWNIPSQPVKIVID